MELKCHRYGVMNVFSVINHTKRRPRYGNGMTMCEFIKLKAMHHNIIVIQVLDMVYNVTILA
jgi:hypothetical protein